MPRKDIYHDLVSETLEREGWTVTDDPLHIALDDADVYIDLAAECILGAVRGETQIAVEIKNFADTSVMHDLEMALGKFVLYRDMSSETEPETDPLPRSSRSNLNRNYVPARWTVDH